MDHSEAPPVADHRRRTLAPAPARSLLLPQHQHEYTTPHHSPLHLNARTTAVCIDRRNMSWLVVVASDPAGPPSYPKAKAAQKKPTVPLPRGSPGGHVNARRATSPSVTSARPSSGLDTRRSAAGPRVATRRGEGARGRPGHKKVKRRRCPPRFPHHSTLPLHQSRMAGSTRARLAPLSFSALQQFQRHCTGELAAIGYGGACDESRPSVLIRVACWARPSPAGVMRLSGLVRRFHESGGAIMIVLEHGYELMILYYVVSLV